MVMMSPYANSIRPQAMPRSAALSAAVQPQQFGGLGSLADLLRQMGGNVETQQPQASLEGRPAPNLEELVRPMDPRLATADVRQEPANPFEGNEQYQALMEFQQSLSPSAEQQQRLQELQSAFEGTGAYKDYRIQQMEQQLQQRQNPMMGMGLGGMRPYGMEPYRGFGRPQQFPMQQPMPMPRGGYEQYQQQYPNNYGGYGQQPQYQAQQYMNPYQQMQPQPQQYGGYNQYQQMGGYGNYGQMPNPYQPQQMGYNTNNYGNYAQNQFQGYGGMQAQMQGVY